MIIKSYLVEDDIKFFEKNKSILFYGENTGLKNHFRRFIIANFKVTIFKKTQDEILNNTEQFFQNFFNKSLFEDSKIFLIDGANDKILDLFKEVELKLDNNKLFVFSDLLDKKSKLRSYYEKSNELAVIACYQDNINTVKNIIKKELSSFNNLTTENINIISDNCNLDRDRLWNELEKIKVYFSNKNINNEQLNILLNLKTNDDFTRIRDEALNGNKKNINKLLSETVIDKDKNIYYLNILNQRFNKIQDILKSSKTKSLDKVVNEIRPPIFWKDKPIILQQLQKWNLDKIRMTLNKSYDLELKFKSNATMDHSLLLKMFLVDVCNLANS